MTPIYLHIYNRGVSRRRIFEHQSDYSHMFELFNRYLGPTRQKDRCGRRYPNYFKKVNLLSFCLMPNHFHFVVELYDIDAALKFIHSLKTAYCKYFNLKYERSGYVFESEYHRRLIETEDDYLHISRYVHLNPLAITRDYKSYPYSSLQFYINGNPPVWLNTKPILSCFDSPEAYLQFHEDYIRELAAATLND